MRQENKPWTRVGDAVAGRGGGMGNPQVGEHSMLEEQPESGRPDHCQYTSKGCTTETLRSNGCEDKE